MTAFHELTFVFWGYGSEDVLGPLRADLQRRGLRCLALPDPALSAADELALLSKTPFVFLTSAHFTRDGAILADLYPAVKIGAGPLQLISACRPVASVFYPHDLGTPLVLSEPQVLPSAFDLVLWPTRHYGYDPPPRRLRTVGWIGFQREAEARARTQDADEQARVTWLFSDFVYHHKALGLDGTFRKLAPVLEAGTGTGGGVAIKFPLWPGHREFEAHFSERGARVIPAEESSFEAILSSSLVISNGLSGVTFEAHSAGIPVLNLLEDYLPPGAQREFVGPLRGCQLARYEDAPAVIASPPKAPPRQIEPFDFDAAYEAIRETCEDRLRLRTHRASA